MSFVLIASISNSIIQVVVAVKLCNLSNDTFTTVLLTAGQKQVKTHQIKSKLIYFKYTIMMNSYLKLSTYIAVINVFYNGQNLVSFV